MREMPSDPLNRLTGGCDWPVVLAEEHRVAKKPVDRTILIPSVVTVAPNTEDLASFRPLYHPFQVYTTDRPAETRFR